MHLNDAPTPQSPPAAPLLPGERILTPIFLLSPFPCAQGTHKAAAPSSSSRVRAEGISRVFSHCPRLAAPCIPFISGKQAPWPPALQGFIGVPWSCFLLSCWLLHPHPLRKGWENANSFLRELGLGDMHVAAWTCCHTVGTEMTPEYSSKYSLPPAASQDM